MSESKSDWRGLADRLYDHGVPRKRARVVALIHCGRTHSQVADELGMSNRNEVSTHVRRYRTEDLPNARWLAENAPEI
jgi:hypothetical protein